MGPENAGTSLHENVEARSSASACARSRNPLVNLFKDVFVEVKRKISFLSDVSDTCQSYLYISLVAKFCGEYVFTVKCSLDSVGNVRIKREELNVS